MALGQAAGTAAHLAIASGREVRAVDVGAVQRELLKQGQVITFFRDIDAIARPDVVIRDLHAMAERDHVRASSV